jgi:hypothetical protein
VFGLLDMPQPDNSDYEEDVFVREQDYEAKRRRPKAKKKGRRLYSSCASGSCMLHQEVNFP